MGMGHVELDAIRSGRVGSALARRGVFGEGDSCLYSVSVVNGGGWRPARSI